MGKVDGVTRSLYLSLKSVSSYIFPHVVSECDLLSPVLGVSPPRDYRVRYRSRGIVFGA